MNLTDALKTGRRIRKNNGEVWYHGKGDENPRYFTQDDILCTTWDVEPERYEFECKLGICTNGSLTVWDADSFATEITRQIPKHVKCKVTVEVLTDEKTN